MECERLNRLVRAWYLLVQEEALAPARMVEFMEKHVKGCEICLADPDVRSEVKKIIEIVLPPSKMAKTLKNDDDTESGEEDKDDSPSLYYSKHDDEDLSAEEETDDDEDEDVEEEFVPSMMDDD